MGGNLARLLRRAAREQLHDSLSHALRQLDVPFRAALFVPLAAGGTQFGVPEALLFRFLQRGFLY
jgi:hypothetical protein